MQHPLAQAWAALAVAAIIGAFVGMFYPKKRSYYGRNDGQIDGMRVAGDGTGNGGADGAVSAANADGATMTFRQKRGELPPYDQKRDKQRGRKRGDGRQKRDWRDRLRQSERDKRRRRR